MKKIESAPSQKRRRGNNDAMQPVESPTIPSSTNREAVATAETRVRVQPNPTPITTQAVLDQSWWDTGDAIRYFGAIDGGVSPREAVQNRIEKLQRGYTTATGWKLDIDDLDQQELCSLHKISN
jgi:hypothetical protein